jgi:hypothetical protein
VNLKAWERWQLAAGPWRGWAVCPALTMPDSSAAPGGASNTSTVVDLLETLAEGDTAVVLDVDPMLGVRSAARASRRGLAHVVLVLPRWPHADAVLPVDNLLAALVATSRQLRSADGASNVVFILDGERQRSTRRPSDDPRVDNRYVLAVGDLPNLATLRGAGIRRLVRVVRQQ